MSADDRKPGKFVIDVSGLDLGQDSLDRIEKALNSAVIGVLAETEKVPDYVVYRPHRYVGKEIIPLAQVAREFASGKATISKDGKVNLEIGQP